MNTACSDLADASHSGKALAMQYVRTRATIGAFGHAVRIILAKPRVVLHRTLPGFNQASVGPEKTQLHQLDLFY